MAKVWPVYDGQRPTIGEPWANIPLPEVIDLFELRQDDFRSDLDSPPHFGLPDRDLTYAGFKHIVVEVDRNEGRRAKWKPGFYRSRVRPEEAFGRLIRQAMSAKLGAGNLIRLEWEPGTDSQGRQAIKITAVIAPEAVQRLKGGAVLDALVNVQERLTEMHEDRIPLVEFATEAELQQDAGS